MNNFMRNHWTRLAPILVLGLLLNACNEAGIIGENIIPNSENINIQYTDTFGLTATTVRQDSVKVYDVNPALQPGRYLTGRVDDPVFGVYQSDIYTQFELLTTNPLFENGVVDSVILIVAYDDKGHYGDFSQPYKLNVYEVTEFLNPDVNHFSQETFETAAMPLATLNFTPAPYDSVLVDSNKLKAHLRIPLDPALGQRFLSESDSTVFENDDFFTNYFKGIKLEGSDPNNEAILAFDLLDGLTQMIVYYRRDTTQETFTLRIKSGSTKTMHFQHNYNGSPVADFIDNAAFGDSLVFAQSMEGLNVKLNIPHIQSLDQVIVNKAELVVTVANNDNSELYPLPEQLVLLRKLEDGTLVFIEDAAISLTRTAGFGQLFGGQPETGDNSTVTYRMNLSGYLQDIIDGRFTDNDFYLSTYPKPDTPSRVILGGAKHSQYPIRLELTYTKLD